VQAQADAAATPTQPQAAIPAAPQLLLAATFSPIASQPLLDMQNLRIAVPVNQIDGEFIVTMAMAGTPGTISVTPAAPVGAAGAIPGQPGAPPPATAPLEKRQSNETATANAGGNIVMTMSQLSDMVQMQKSGGVMSVWTMMNQFVSQEAGQPELTLTAVKARSSFQERRASSFRT
jgi:hypothetical protein